MDDVTRPATDLPRSYAAVVSAQGPEAPRRLVLRTMRLMAVGGINDATATAALFGHFGRAYRRPLVLIRALMLELARTSKRRIVLAPPCCGRITRDETVILRAFARTESEFVACHDDVRHLLGRRDALGAATCFQAVASCFADLGAPFG